MAGQINGIPNVQRPRQMPIATPINTSQDVIGFRGEVSTCQPFLSRIFLRCDSLWTRAIFHGTRTIYTRHRQADVVGRR